MTPTSEEWRPVVGYEGHYEVSDQGRVRSVERLTYAGRGRKRRVPPRVLKPQTHGTDGRRHVRLSVDAVAETKLISVLVLNAFVGPRPPGMVVCHNNGDASDDCLANLRWDTSRENNLDMIRHGTHWPTNRTKCRRGHQLNAPNLVPSKARRGAHRDCLACSRGSANVRAARRRGQNMDLQAAADDHYARIMRAA